MNYRIEARKQHQKLDHYARQRTLQLSRLFKTAEQIAIEEERLLCRLAVMLGESPPVNVVDRAVRDLFADTFDALFLARQVIMEGFPSPGFGLLRRAFESTSLLQHFLITSGAAAKWTAGARISNAQVRKSLGEHPFGEQEDSLRDAYSFYSSGAHPNRSFIPVRYLGEGNQFVFGAIGRPSLALVAQKLEYLLAHWFWLCAILSVRYLDVTNARDKTFGADYMALAERNLVERKDLRRRQADYAEYESGEPEPPDLQ